MHRLDWLGTEALLREVSKEVCAPVLFMAYKYKNGKITWWAKYRVSHAEREAHGCLSSSKYQECRSALIADRYPEYSDSNPSGISKYPKYVTEARQGTLYGKISNHVRETL